MYGWPRPAVKPRCLRSSAAASKCLAAAQPDLPMHPILWLILTILDIYVWILIAAVIVSWLVAFNIINRSNEIVRQVTYALFRLTEPVLAPIRRFLPDLGGLDISPVIAIIVIYFIRYLLFYYGSRMV